MRLQTMMCGTAAAALSCAAYFGMGYTPAAAAPAPAAAEAPAAPALSPVTITDHGEALTMLLPPVTFQKKETGEASLGFSISSYLARVEAAGLDVLIQYTAFEDGRDAAPTFDAAVAGVRDAIKAAYQCDRMERDERLDLGGTPGHLFSYSYMVDGVRYVDDSVVVIYGSNPWNITFSHRADNTTAEPYMNEVLNSIRVGAAQ